MANAKQKFGTTAWSGETFNTPAGACIKPSLVRKHEEYNRYELTLAPDTKSPSLKKFQNAVSDAIFNSPECNALFGGDLEQVEMPWKTHSKDGSPSRFLIIRIRHKTVQPACYQRNAEEGNLDPISPDEIEQGNEVRVQVQPYLSVSQGKIWCALHMKSVFRIGDECPWSDEPVEVDVKALASSLDADIKADFAS